MDKTKLMIVAQSNGGVSEYLKNLIRYIDKKKYDVILVLSDQYKLEYEVLKKLECKIHFLDMTRDINLKKDIESVIKLKKIIKITKPNLIYAHSSKAGALVRISVSNKKIPIIYNAHGWAFNMRVNKIKRKLYKNIERLLSNNTSKIICISDYEKNSALDIKICKPDKVETIYNGIDLKSIKRIEKNKILNNIGFPKNSLVIGQVGRLDEQKNPLLFVDIAKEIIDKNIDAYFILVGDGMLKDQVEKQIERYNLTNRFHITGWISNVSDYISCFDIGMLTSKWEGFGLVLLEYMALDVPIIASNVDGIPNVVSNNVDGILCDSDKKNEFVEAIVSVLQNKDLYNNLQNNGKKSVNSKFSIERVVEEHDKVFSNILKGEVR